MTQIRIRCQVRVNLIFPYVLPVAVCIQDAKSGEMCFAVKPIEAGQPNGQRTRRRQAGSTLALMASYVTAHVVWGS
jgi:hypothetical protein